MARQGHEITGARIQANTFSQCKQNPRQGHSGQRSSPLSVTASRAGKAPNAGAAAGPDFAVFAVLPGRALMTHRRPIGVPGHRGSFCTLLLGSCTSCPGIPTASGRGAVPPPKLLDAHPLSWGLGSGCQLRTTLGRRAPMPRVAVTEVPAFPPSHCINTGTIAVAWAASFFST